MTKSTEKGKGKPSSRTNEEVSSISELKGIIKSRRNKAPTLQEMKQAIIKGAIRSHRR